MGGADLFVGGVVIGADDQISGVNPKSTKCVALGGPFQVVNSPNLGVRGACFGTRCGLRLTGLKQRPMVFA